MACVGCNNDEESQGRLPPVYRATEDQLLAGLRRMSPGMSLTELRSIAVALKRRNEADSASTRAAPGGAAQPPFDGRSTARRSAIDVRLMRVEIPSIVGRAWSYIRAVLPWWLGRRAPDRVIEARRLKCLSQEHGAPCRWLVQEGARLFCAACECPHTRASHLGNKTVMPRAKCVLGLWPVGEPGTQERTMT